MVAHVILKVRQAKQQLEEIVVLRLGMSAAVLAECVHDEIRIGQQPIEGAPLHRLGTLAKLKRRAQPRETLLDVVVQAKRFLGQGCGYTLVASDHPARTKRDHHQRTPPKAFGGLQAAFQILESRVLMQRKHLAEAAEAQPLDVFPGRVENSLSRKLRSA